MPVHSVLMISNDFLCFPFVGVSVCVELLEYQCKNLLVSQIVGIWCEFFSLNNVRKCHYDHFMASAHIKGIGGPGAPHCFRLERISDAGLLSLPTLYLVFPFKLEASPVSSSHCVPARSPKGRSGCQVLATTSATGTK